MQREIKFKAWDSKQKIMFHLFRMCKPKDSGTLAFECKDIYHEDWEQASWEDLTVMQFTGLLDKNGKEIYESDLLKDTDGNIYQVSWQQDLASFCIHREGWMYRHWFGEGLNPADVEVIGNVFEKSDLLTS